MACSEYGFCYSNSNSNPTVNDGKKVSGTNTTGYMQDKPYSDTISGLSSGSTYYIRSYGFYPLSSSPVYGPVTTVQTTAGVVTPPPAPAPAPVYISPPAPTPVTAQIVKQTIIMQPSTDGTSPSGIMRVDAVSTDTSCNNQAALTQIILIDGNVWGYDWTVNGNRIPNSGNGSWAQFIFDRCNQKEW